MLFPQRKTYDNISLNSSFFNVLYTSKAKAKSEGFQDFDVNQDQNLSKHSTAWFNPDLWPRMVERLQEELSLRLIINGLALYIYYTKTVQFSELNTMIATYEYSSRCMYNMLHHGAETVYIYFVCAQCNYDKAIPWNELTSVRTTTEQHSSLLFFLHRTKPHLHTISLVLILYS